ncbi:MAG TPA: DUF6159 family protein [Methanoregulaceae archaeon]|nr:MAG: hypothetical protein IPI71_05335 [Methanolinea sp.]HON80693.1 DUF6159 family protein [Methanoregulaceae archaeon]HRT14780.1 DUF6159 family protein [Methanoregulaceae archaeon]HRU30353.1 DUF6159 family protein [Methanoregulaceae archaeon]
MAGTLSRSIDLLKNTWRVLMMDKELLLFPVLSGLGTILIALSFLLPIFFMGILGEIGGFGPLVWFLALFFFYYVSYAVVIFFNTGLIACATIRFSGGDPTVRDGIRFSLDNLGKILSWALVAATVGLVLNLLSRRSGFISRIIIAIIGIAWSLATFLVIPVMVFEDKSVFAAISDSWQLLKRTWGENIIVHFGLGILFVPPILLMLFTILSVMTGNLPLVFVMTALTIIGFVVSGILHATLHGIFVAALYQFATTGTIPGHMQGNLIREAFVPEVPPVR